MFSNKKQQEKNYSTWYYKKSKQTNTNVDCLDFFERLSCFKPCVVASSTCNCILFKPHHLNSHGRLIMLQCSISIQIKIKSSGYICSNNMISPLMLRPSFSGHSYKQAATTGGKQSLLVLAVVVVVVVHFGSTNVDAFTIFWKP